jgi:hypothetical protein
MEQRRAEAEAARLDPDDLPEELEPGDSYTSTAEPPSEDDLKHLTLSDQDMADMICTPGE